MDKRGLVPPGVLKLLHLRRQFAGVVQVVERLLAKEKVVGSSPIARSDGKG